MNALSKLVLKSVLLAGFTTILSAQDYSRHCKGPGDSDALISDGTYKGKWEVGVTFTQDIGGSPLVQTIKGHGEFTLKVDRGSNSVGKAANLSKLEGELKSSTEMKWVGPGGGQANQNLNGSGSLQLDGEVEGSQFKAKAEHHTSGQIQVSAPMASSAQGQSFSDTVTLTFVADQGNCDGASGHLLSDSLTGMIDMMRQVGYTVENHSWTWEMSRVPEDGDPVQKFKDELEKKAPEGIVRTRAAEATRLGKLADRIKNDEPASIRECLWRLWSQHVVQQYLSWASEDTQKLKGFKGDWGTLQDLVKRALDTDRALSLLGVDTCATSVHQDLWTSIQTALCDYLKRMAEGGAPMTNLLAALQQAELLGVVSPGLEAQVMGAVQEQASQLQKSTFASFQAAVQAANSAHRTPAQDPTVVAACHRAINAERAAQLLGVDAQDSTALATSIGLI